MKFVDVCLTHQELENSYCKNKIVVITGVSGSGKSTLIYDTIYAEAQRRYVESLSSYARQFLKNRSKPEFDEIKGLSPAIALETKTNINNPRSTVGTTTEIYHFITLLYERLGKVISPISKKEVTPITFNKFKSIQASIVNGEIEIIKYLEFLFLEALRIPNKKEIIFP